MACTDPDCRCLRPCVLSPDEFLVAVGGSTMQHSGLDGRVHSTLKLGFDGRIGASISVDA